MVGSYNRNANAICFCFIFCADGLRTARTNGTDSWEYVYNGSQLVGMKKGNDTLYFTYDASGTPTTVTHNGTVYYYVTNHQGDVVRIVDASGTTVATYTYDAWGNPISTTNTTPSTLESLNPLRYRGYVYDAETGFYYLQSRYYNPEIGRFLNADGQLSGVGGDILGYNMFAYCMNNPVNTFDSSGNWPKWIEKGAMWLDKHIVTPVKELVANVCEDVNNFDLDNESANDVLSSNYFSSYHGRLVIKTPFSSSFSFGVIGLGTDPQNEDILRHEYGHCLQMNDLGLYKYVTDVFIPSATINILNKYDKLPYDYYSYPWEAEANKLGGSTLSETRKPALPQGGYTSYMDLIKLFSD